MCVHYTVNWFCTFSNTTSLSPSSSRVCEWNLCHEIAREFICMRVCVSVVNFIYATFYPLILFFTRNFASLFYLLTLYNIVFTSFLPLFYDLLFVLTKPNWTFLLYFFFIRLEDCCCCLVFLFSLQRAMCTSDVTRRYLIERVYLCVCVLVSSRACFDVRRGCLRVWEWGCLNSCFFLFCFASGKRD